MKRIVCTLLLLAMLVAAVSCTNGAEKGNPDSGTTENTTAGDSTTTVSDNTTQEKPYLETLPDIKYNGAKLSILCTEQTQNFYNKFEQSADTVDNAVYLRNIAVAERYDVDITYSALNGNSNGQTEFANAVRTSTQSGNEGYDLIVAQSYYMLPLAVEGCLQDLMQSEYLHWDEAWYHQKINDNGAINGKCYGASGTYVMSQISYAMGVFFNKEAFADRNEGVNLYELVREGKWSFDRLAQYCSDVYEDTDENRYPSDGDSFGYVYHQHGLNAAIVGSDCPITSTDESGNPTFKNYYNEHLIKVFDTYHTFFNENNGVYCIKGDYNPLVMLANGKTLFACAQIGGMNDCPELRAAEIKYGVLPYPKFTAEQEVYLSYTMRWELFYIPSNADFDRSCIVLEYLNYTSDEIMIPAYWELALGVKSANNENDSDMLNIIKDTLYYDFATFFSSQLNNIKDAVAGQLQVASKRLSSWWDSKGGEYEKKLQDLLVAYE